MEVSEMPVNEFFRMMECLPESAEWRIEARPEGVFVRIEIEKD
jgi:hypothetical protein